MANKTAPESQPDAAPKRVTAALVKPHTHRGVDRKAGETIELSERQAAWLKQLGIIE